MVGFKGVTRREFIKHILFFWGPILTGGSISYLDNRHMKKPPVETEHHLLLDSHVHLSAKEKPENLVLALSKGITVITAISGSKGILTYNQAIQLEGVTETEDGIMAKVEHEGNVGYIVRGQEIVSDKHHIVGISWKDNPNVPITSHADSRRTVEEIQKRGGLAILAHGYAVRRDFGFTYPSYEEEKRISELLRGVDGAETFNSNCICLVPGLFDVSDANRRMLETVQTKTKLRGLNVSDTHYQLKQHQLSGVMVPKEHFCLEALCHYITSGAFINNSITFGNPRISAKLQNYVSRWSFIKGTLRVNFDECLE